MKKKSGKVRITTDFKVLNSKTIKDSYPLPLINDTIDVLAGNSYFCITDITSAYHNIPVAEHDKYKTAMVCKYGTYEWNVLPQGTVNGPAHWQRVVELVLRRLQWEVALAYLDDILVFGKSFLETVERLAQVFQRIQDAGLKLSPDKTSLFQHSVAFLGRVISREGSMPDPDKVAKIREWPTPKNQTDVRAFCGLANYYSLDPAFRS